MSDNKDNFKLFAATYVEYVPNFYFYFSKRMTGASASFSYLVSKEYRLLSFVMCPLLAPHIPRHFGLFWLQPITVLKRQTRQAIHATDQSIFLRCYGFITVEYFTNTFKLN
jgi:hypothetical protein